MTDKNNIISSNFVNDIRTIIECGKQQAYAVVGQVAIMAYWNVGRCIVEEEQHGETRMAYGLWLIKNLSVELMPVYRNNCSKRNQSYYRKFYLSFPNVEIVHTHVHNYISKT